MSFSGRPQAWDDSQPTTRRVESAPEEPHAVICGVDRGDGMLCNYPPHSAAATHSWSDPCSGYGQEQPPPVPNDGPSMHDLVIADIMSRPVSWDLSYGKASRLRDQVAGDLLARKQHGLNLYGSLLQAHNGRDALRDAYEEAQDLAVYLRQCLLEVPETSLEWTVLAEVYDDVVTALVRLVRVRLARSGTHGAV